jgi:hypothetical protein
MKRILLISVLLVIAISMSFGQIAYKQGDNVVSAMFGLGSSISYGSAKTDVPPLSVAFDYGFNENISLGGIVGYTASSESGSIPFFGSYEFKYSDFIIGARGAYHYDLLHNEMIDTYGGLVLGYDVASASATGFGTAASAGGLVIGGFIGGRYYFTPNLGAQLELGYGIAYFNIGIAYKL